MSKEQFAQLLEKAPPFSPTKLEISRSMGLARVRITESSGNTQLDLAALDALKEKVKYLPENVPDTAASEETAPYIPPKGEDRRIKVEWRLMEEKMQEQDDNN